MERRVNFVLVGTLVVVLGIALVGIILWLGKGDYRATYDRYYVYMTESVAGLSINSPVKYNGVEVGYVSEIVLNPENPGEVRLSLEIQRGTPIKEDTIAMLYVQGLTGFAIIDLTGGSPDAPLLTARPGAKYPVIKTSPSFFARIDRTGSNLLNNLNRVLEDTQRLVDEENRENLKQILIDLAALSQTLAGHTERVAHGVENAAEAAGNLAELTYALNEQVPGLLNRVDRSMAAVERMTRDVSQSSAAFNSVVRDTGPNLQHFSRETLAETGLLVAELRQLTGSLSRLTRHLEQEPQSLIYGRTSGQPGPGE